MGGTVGIIFRVGGGGYTAMHVGMQGEERTHTHTHTQLMGRCGKGVREPGISDVRCTEGCTHDL